MKHYLRVLGLAVVLFTSQHGTAQSNFCGTDIPSQQWETKFQELAAQNKQTRTNSRTEAVVFTIPVIIHVIHGGQAVGTYPNLAQGQLASQIQVLNNDYAGVGLYTNNYPTSAFTNWASAENLPAANLDGSGRVKIANCNVQFCLATKDTLGNLLSEPGIDRVDYTSRGWVNPFSFTSSTSFKNFIDGTVKPQTIWNVSRYLNIWVTDENINAAGIGGLLGYATFPPLSGLSGLPGVGTNTTDGFWCYAKGFGSATIFPAGNYYANTYNKGRTCTHEIGHWLGLRHIWGDGTCLTDYCDDTPGASTSNSGTPSYPYHVGSCTGNSPDGEMYMNFMDYTNDNGKYMFTPDQASRMETAMTTSPYRKFMGTHGLCSVANVAAASAFSVNASACEGATVTLNNNSFGTPAPSYSWSAANGITFIPNAGAVSPSVTFPGPGTYTINLAADNGTTSSASQTIIIKPLPTVSLTVNSQTICSPQQVSITASGANFYSWAPGGATGAVLSYYASNTGVSTYTCNATGLNGCKAKATITMVSTDCTGITEQMEQINAVTIYPNPANDKINVLVDVASSLNMTIEFSDITGKLLLQQQAMFAKDKQVLELNIAPFENGVYLLKLISQEQVRVLKVIKEN